MFFNIKDDYKEEKLYFNIVNKHSFRDSQMVVNHCGTFLPKDC